MELYYCSNCDKMLLSYEVTEKKSYVSSGTCYGDIYEDIDICCKCKDEVVLIDRQECGTISMDLIKDFVIRCRCNTNIKASIDDGVYTKVKAVSLEDIDDLMLLDYMVDIINLAYEGDTLYMEIEMFKEEV